MKRLLPIFGLLVFAILGAIPVRAQTFLNFSAGSGTTNNVTITNTNDVLHECQAQNGTGIGAPGISDTKGNSSTQVGSTVTGNGTGGNNLQTSCWCAVANGTGSDTITISGGATNYNSLYVEIHSVAASCTPDQKGQIAAPSSTSSVTVPSITTTCSTDALVAYVADPNNSSAPTQGTGWTKQGGAAGYMTQMETQTTSSTGAFNPGWTLGTSDNDWNSHIVAYSTTGGTCSGGPPCKPTLTLLGVGRCG